MNSEAFRVFLLKKKVLFPHSNQNMIIRKTPFSEGLKAGDRIITYSIRNYFDIFLIRRRVSTLAEITEITADKNVLRFQVKGICRVRIRALKRLREAFFVPVESAPAKNEMALCRELRTKAQELIFLINVDESDRLIALLNFLSDLNQISDFIANYFILDNKLRIALINETDITRRCNKLNGIISKLINNFKNQAAAL